MSVKGTLIVESLTPDADLAVAFSVIRLHRVAITDPAPGQPPVWTLIDFECADEDIDAFTQQLAAGLAEGPWYVDASTDTTKYVIFAGKVFVFARGDAESNHAAVEHGRRVGVPETQLDWPI